MFGQRFPGRSNRCVENRCVDICSDLKGLGHKDDISNMVTIKCINEVECLARMKDDH
jgi:hypothetical protein